MNHTLLDYFRCPDDFAKLEVHGPLSEEAGFFHFGSDAICYGQYSGAQPSRDLPRHLPDALQDTRIAENCLTLPFELSQVIDNLRMERYRLHSERSFERAAGRELSRRLYYLIRPLLPVNVRKHLQRVSLHGWDKILFPRWPVDFSVESIMQRVMSLLIKSSGLQEIPFIWFWPGGAPSCVMMTHDVESITGRNFCGQLMDLDDAFGTKSAFQIIPEDRYDSSNGFLDKLRARGFEVNVHDLNHDGALFNEREEFLRRAEKINRYLQEFHTNGFRAGAMYRRQDWYSAFHFAYDMSVPNVAHLEPQRGGCCTVMPFYMGKILELPLTTTQDYSLFHIMGDYSIELWKLQIEIILGKSGLISFIVHPDYIVEKRAREVYLDLLGYLARLRADRKLWAALPREINAWWRDRSQMKLVHDGGKWSVEGPGKERARVAYAAVEGDRLVYRFENAA